MFLYRIIPDTLTTIIKIGGISKRSLTTEDLFYKIGYMNISQHSPYFCRRTDPILLNDKLWQEDGKKGIYFYTSPMDCIKTFKCINNEFYSDSIGRILEYDIPDGIIMNYSTRGNGIYGGIEVPEIKVPLEIIQKADSSNVMSECLANQLQQEEQKQIEETMELLKEFEAKRIEGIINNPEKRNRLLELKFGNCGVFWKSNYITGRCCCITKEAILDYEESNNIEMLKEQGIDIFKSDKKNIDDIQYQNKKLVDVEK